MRISSAVLTGLLLPSLLALPVVTAPAAQAQPVSPDVQSVPLLTDEPETMSLEAATEVAEAAAASSSDPGRVAFSDPDTEPFQLVGVTWEAAADVQDLSVRVRVRTDSGWSAWETLEAMDESPDGDTSEGIDQDLRVGTAPLVTGEAQGVEVAVDGGRETLPAGLRVDLIDPGESPADAQLEPTRPAASADAAAAQPTIISRASWGADPKLLNGSPSYMSTIKAGVIHHTAGSNNYTSSEAAAQVRGIYAYHTNSLGWNDIGYNFLVDKFGRIYEGRAGGIDRAVQGAHAGGFNEDTFGVSAMGNYETAIAPTVMTDAIARVTAWKLGLYGLDPQGTTKLTSAGGGTSRYSKGTVVTKNIVSAHRDVGLTACPGTNVYSKMSTIRSLAEGYTTTNDVERVSGYTKFDTSVAIGKETFPDSKTVVIVSSDDGRRADGAVAAPLAYSKSAPVLLSTRAGLSTAVLDDIKRRGVTRAYLVGGALALSSNIESQLRAAGVSAGSITRFAGATRYETASMVARGMGNTPWGAFVASGNDRNLIDALAAGGIGARNAWPVLLTDRDQVPAVTLDTLKDLGVARTFAVGGTLVISDNVVRQLPGGSRVAGATLYDTAVALATNFANIGTSRVVIASGDRYNIIDALAGGTFGNVIVLTQRDTLTPVTKSWLGSNTIDKAVVVGGPLAVSDNTVLEVSKTLG